MGGGEAPSPVRGRCGVVRGRHGGRTASAPAEPAEDSPPFTAARFANLAIGATLLIGVTGFVAYDVGSSVRSRAVRDYGARRAQVVAYASGNLKDGYVMLAGDSHAELARPDPPSCGRPILNAGISGAKADDYVAFLDGLTLKHRPSVVIVTLGTNHLTRKHNTVGRAVADRYEASLGGVVERLSRLADRVVVAAVPPAGPSLGRRLDHAGVEALTLRQARVCARLGCTTVDPYAAYRGAEFGATRPGATEDGLHLNEYATAYRAIDRMICPQ